ncbi:hypothetical protein FACS1894167_09980 [Synergistales bacterium]|nr:hypothetical protein FACS1894167_09980 [Synergistales bacterium]
MYAYIGFFAFSLWGDDFYFLLNVRDYGFWEAQHRAYVSVMGRFFNTFLISLVCAFENIGMFFDAYRFLVVSLIGLSLFSIFFFVRSVLPGIAAGKAALVSLFCQSLWLNEVLYSLACELYYVSCCMILIEAGLLIRIARRERASLEIAALSVAAFLNGGLIEFGAVFSIVMLLSALCWLLSVRNNRGAARLVLPVIAALAGLGADYFSPGSQGRIGGHLDLIGTIKETALYCAPIVADALLSPLKYVFLLFLPDIMKFTNAPEIGHENIRGRLKVWHGVALTVLGVFLLSAIGVYSIRGYGLARRCEYIIQWLMWFCWIIYFVWFYSSAASVGRIAGSAVYRRRHGLAVIFFLLSFNTRDAVVSAFNAAEFRSELDAQRELLLRVPQGGTAYVPYAAVYNKLLVSDASFAPFNDNLYNVCVEYYRLSAVHVAPKEFLAEHPDTVPTLEYYIDMYNKAAEGGNAAAFTTLGRIYDIGLLGSERDPEKAKHYYSLGTDRGSVASARSLLRILMEDGSSLNYGQLAQYGVKYLLNIYVWRKP